MQHIYPTAPFSLSPTHYNKVSPSFKNAQPHHQPVAPTSRTNALEEKKNAATKRPAKPPQSNFHLFLSKLYPTMPYGYVTTDILALAFAGSLTFFGVVVVPWLLAA